MARQSIDRFITDVNDQVDVMKTPSPAKAKVGKATEKAYIQDPITGAIEASEEPCAPESGDAVVKPGTSREATSRSRSPLSSRSAGAVLGGWPDDDAEAEERVLEARAVLNLPGYRENKVRTLLFRNNELEQALQEEKDTVRNLVRLNDALEHQIFKLNHSRTSSPHDAPRTAPASFPKETLWGQDVASPQSKRLSLVSVSSLETSADNGQQDPALIAELQAKVTHLNTEVSDIFGELQRCLAEQKRLQTVASQAEQQYSVVVAEKAEIEASLAESRRQLQDLQARVKDPPATQMPDTDMSFLGSPLALSAAVSPAAARRRSLRLPSSVCPLGLAICNTAGVCVCGEWEARLSKAESQVAVEQERCADLGEQLNKQLAREISLESSLADLQAHCDKVEDLNKVLVKEAEYGATQFEARFAGALECSECALVSLAEVENLAQGLVAEASRSNKQGEARRAEIASLQAQLLNRDAMIKAQKEAGVALHKEHEKLRAKCGALEDELNEKRVQVVERDADLRGKEAIITSRDETISSHLKTISELQKGGSTAAKATMRLQRELEEVKREKDELEAVVAQGKIGLIEAERLRGQVVERDAEIKSLQLSMAAGRAALQQAESLRDQVSELQGREQERERERERERIERVQMCEEHRNALAEAMQKMKKEGVERLTPLLQTLLSDLKEQQAQLNAVQDDEAVLQQQLSALEEKEAENRKLMVMMMEEESERDAKFRTQDEERRAQDDELMACRNQVEALKILLAAAEEELGEKDKEVQRNEGKVDQASRPSEREVPPHMEPFAYLAEGYQAERDAAVQRAASAEAEVQRLQDELGGILLALEDLAHINASWLASRMRKSLPTSRLGNQGALGRGVGGDAYLTASSTPLQVRFKANAASAQTGEGFVALGSVIDGELVPVSSAFKPPRELITPPSSRGSVSAFLTDSLLATPGSSGSPRSSSRRPQRLRLSSQARELAITLCSSPSQPPTPTTHGSDADSSAAASAADTSAPAPTTAAALTRANLAHDRAGNGQQPLVSSLPGNRALAPLQIGLTNNDPAGVLGVASGVTADADGHVIMSVAPSQESLSTPTRSDGGHTDAPLAAATTTTTPVGARLPMPSVPSPSVPSPSVTVTPVTPSGCPATPRPVVSWTPLARRKGPLPPLEITVVRALNLSAGTGEASGGIYCRLRLNRETFHTEVVPTVTGIEERPNRSNSIDTGCGAGLTAEWNQHHVFVPDRVTREVHVAVLTALHDVIGRASLLLADLREEVWEGAHKDGRELPVLTMAGDAVVGSEGRPATVYLEFVAATRQTDLRR